MSRGQFDIRLIGLVVSWFFLILGWRDGSHSFPRQVVEIWQFTLNTGADDLLVV
jgi:hypothetical protein